MSRVRILSRVLHQLEEQAGGRRGGEFVGLLLGTASPEATWIERALPCRPAEGGIGSELIDPRVVESVSRSLAGRSISLLGAYRIEASTSNGESGTARVAGWIGEGLLLEGAVEEAGVRRLRLWSPGDDGALERELDIIQPVARPFANCPD